MSRRTLGGGRVLGSGKSLSPAVPPAQKPHAQNLYLSPSASTLSLGSGVSTPPSSESQDLTSRISVDHGDTSLASAAAAAGAKMVCPICNEEMVTLLQLNRHLDDVHKEIEEERQDEVKDWFKTQMLKAKKFQPLAVLNQKLKGLDVFESNDEVAVAASTAVRHGSDPNISAPLPPRPAAPPVDPDEAVTRKHWQRHGPSDICSEPMCGKRLTSANGSVNCRHCGKLFCDEHTMYQMKLSRSAQHEPVRGFWCRVCETCYKSRDGYNDKAGFERNHMVEFAKVRRQHVDKTYLEVSRLEKRLTRLTQLLADPPEEAHQAMNKRWSLAWGQNDPRKALEQSVVTWQDDADILRCPYCQQDFAPYTFRRHHCRTCGKVVCGDPATGCSLKIGLNVASSTSFIHVHGPYSADLAPANTITEKSATEIPIDVRLCKECNTTLFSRRDFDLETQTVDPSTRAYSNLTQFEHGIRMLLPRFQKLLNMLQDPDKPPTSAQLAEASKTRKRLMDSFTQYDVAARRIRDLPTTSPTQQKLQKAVYQQASNFLHLHMLPLKTLPKILKHATPHGTARTNGTPSPLPNGKTHSGSALASIKYNSLDPEASSQMSSASSQISALEAEEKSLRERLIVLEEQKFFVSEMIADAKQRRKFDEVAALAGNVEDLGREIDSLQGLLAGLDFEGAYTGTGAMSGLASPTLKGKG
jgi:rabenosyn-5